MHDVMHETQLRHHGWGEDKWIKIRVAHGAVEAVHGEGQRQPGTDDLGHADGFVRIEVDVRRQGFILDQARFHADPEGSGHFQRIDDVQVVRPGLGPVLPRMGAGILADVAFLPVGRRAFLVVAL